MRRIPIFALILSLSIALGQVTWLSDFERAVKLAKEQDKKLMIYFSSDHCPYCWQMENYVLVDPEVERYISDKFIIVSLDVEDIPESVEEKFNVFGTPYIVFYDPKGDRVISELFGSREADDFIAILKRICKKSNLRRC
jgi:thioredoxin-related protein